MGRGVRSVGRLAICYPYSIAGRRCKNNLLLGWAMPGTARHAKTDSLASPSPTTLKQHILSEKVGWPGLATHSQTQKQSSNLKIRIFQYEPPSPHGYTQSQDYASPNPTPILVCSHSASGISGAGRLRTSGERSADLFGNKRNHF